VYVVSVHCPFRLPSNRSALQVALLLLSSSSKSKHTTKSTARSGRKTKWGEATTTHTTHTTTLFVYTLCLFVCHASKETKKEGSFPSRLTSSSTGTERVENEWLWRSESEQQHNSRTACLPHFALPRLSKAWTFGLFLTGCPECVHGGLTPTPTQSLVFPPFPCRLCP